MLIMIVVIVDRFVHSATLHSLRSIPRCTHFAFIDSNVTFESMAAATIVRSAKFKSMAAVFNLSPQHPATHGVLRLIVILHGEIIQ